MPCSVGFDTGALSGLVDGLSLAAHVHKPLYRLSTGSRRKVWLAAAFANITPVTLIDDPFAALDKPSIKHVVAQLRDVASRQQRAVVLADYTVPPDVPLSAIIELPGGARPDACGYHRCTPPAIQPPQGNP